MTYVTNASSRGSVHRSVTAYRGNPGVTAGLAVHWVL